jgi:hypothetical protein
LGSGDDTVWAVVLGAVLATLGGFVAARLESYFGRRERERSAALLFGEILSVLDLILVLADEARGRGDPFGPLTLRMLRAAKRETETYDRNRESLYDLRDPGLRARIHTIMVRVTLSLEGVFESAECIDRLEVAGGPAPDSDDARRLAYFVTSRQGAFEFAIEARGPIKDIVAALQPLAKQPFGDHDAIARSF